jgi:GH25 family lysozyme M1 (1,4-beta-N-acetylmuramidase)
VNFSNHGIIVPDVSFWQDDNSTPNGIDFAQMKAAGAVGVIIRAGQNSWLDPDFKTNWAAAKAAGLPRGSYWFYDSRNEPAKQANMWHAAIGGDLPELWLWADLEESYNGTYKGEANYKKFVLATEAYFPSVTLGVYTAAWWWNPKAALGLIRDDVFWKQYPLWVAQYGTHQADVVLPRPWVGGSPVFWQYTASGYGAEYGVESREIDLNYFNGDKFYSYFKLTETPGGEVIPPQEGDTMKGTVKTFTNIRLDRNKNSADMGDLLAGDVVTWQEEYAGLDGLTWIKLLTATHNGAPIKCVDGADVGGRYCWANNVALDAEPEPEPTPAHVVEVTVDGVVVFRKELA